MDRRSYHEHCGLARALDVVGERWTLLVVRNLLLGPLRYSELLRGLPGITTNLLAKRLREMEAHGLVERVARSADDAGHAYRLTPLGAALEPAIHALGGWGWHWMGRARRGDHRSLEWLLVALRRRYRRHRGRSVHLSAELVADGVSYRVVLSGAGAEIARGAPPAPALRVSGPGPAIAELFLRGWEGRAPSGDLAVDGPPELLRALLDAFDREELPAEVRR